MRGTLTCSQAPCVSALLHGQVSASTRRRPRAGACRWRGSARDSQRMSQLPTGNYHGGIKGGAGRELCAGGGSRMP